MYGNICASGLAGSDTTTTNPLLATTSTVATRTYNQPQPQLPVAAAPLQSHRDDPHLAGNEACLCSSCHLRDRIFPRSQDGRIVLPHPSLFIHSTRLPRPTPTMASAATPDLVIRRRNRIENAASNSDLRSSVAKFNEGRRGGGSRTPHFQSDKGEGSSTGAGRMSGHMGESWMPLLHRSREIISTDQSQHTPELSRRGKPGRSFSGSSRRVQLSKKHDQKPNRPDPWPRILDSEEFAGQPSHLTQLSSSSHHSHSLDKSRKTRLELFLDKHGTAYPQNLSQPFQMRELPPQTATPSTAPQTYIGAYDYEHPLTASPLHQDTSMSMTISNYPESPGHLETPHPHHHHAASRPGSPADTVTVPQNKPKIIRFSARSENPRPDSNPAPTTPTTPPLGEKSIHSSPTREPPPSSSSPSHQLQPPFEGSSSTSLQTQFRFQEPVVPEGHITSPIRSRELSIVQVKWDSERKRRQGYFAQEEGAEKSPFRHYNKANCDFEG